MKKRAILYPYKISSEGAKAVQESLRELGYDCLRVYSDRDYAPKDTDLILGWGAGHAPNWWRSVPNKAAYLNKPEAISRSVDKRDMLEAMERHGVPIPVWTIEHDEAQIWAKRYSVVVRLDADGRDGSGLIINAPGTIIPRAPLYTRFAAVRREWRIHVFKGRAIAEQLKVKIKDTQEDDADRVRVTRNGWGLSYNHDGAPVAVCIAAIRATEALGLDFAGVDVGETAFGEPVVFETNTAPEMTPKTAALYALTIARHLNK